MVSSCRLDVHTHWRHFYRSVEVNTKNTPIPCGFWTCTSVDTRKPSFRHDGKGHERHGAVQQHELDTPPPLVEYPAPSSCSSTRVDSVITVGAVLIKAEVESDIRLSVAGSLLVTS